jgi:hypothetical protein
MYSSNKKFISLIEVEFMGIIGIIGIIGKMGIIGKRGIIGL